MAENEQIEEMAKIICGVESGCNRCVFDSKKCFEYKDAEQLYAKGYRKVERGEWKDVLKDEVMCNICGKFWNTDDNADAYAWKFCPNCGADMRGEKDE